MVCCGGLQDLGAVLLVIVTAAGAASCCGVQAAGGGAKAAKEEYKSLVELSSLGAANDRRYVTFCLLL